MKTITKDKIQFSFDSAVAPAETAESGETVCFQTQDCYAEQIDRTDLCAQNGNACGAGICYRFDRR